LGLANAFLNRLPKRRSKDERNRNELQNSQEKVQDLRRRQEFFGKDYVLQMQKFSQTLIDVPISWKKDYVSLSNIKTKIFAKFSW